MQGTVIGAFGEEMSSSESLKLSVSDLSSRVSMYRGWILQAFRVRK